MTTAEPLLTVSNPSQMFEDNKVLPIQINTG